MVGRRELPKCRDLPIELVLDICDLSDDGHIEEVLRHGLHPGQALKHSCGQQTGGRQVGAEVHEPRQLQRNVT